VNGVVTAFSSKGWRNSTSGAILQVVCRVSMFSLLAQRRKKLLFENPPKWCACVVGGSFLGADVVRLLDLRQAKVC